MSERPGVLVVGHGPAAHRFVAALRGRGHEGPVTVLGAEPGPAYNRALLTAFHDAITLPGPPPGVDVRAGVTARRIDRAKRIVYAGGEAHRYGVLVLATGARPRIPWVPGVTGPDGRLAEGVTALRTRADRERIGPGRVVVLGGGVLGVQAALGLRAGGREVTLVHPHPYPMGRQLDATAGGLVAQHLAGREVALRLGRRAARYRPGKLVLDDGEVLPADTLVLCTGVTPDVGLARRAGLAVRHGVLVDGRLRASDPHIRAIGDCAEIPGAVTGQVASAWDQAEALAALLTGGPAAYRPTRTVWRLAVPGLDVVSLGRQKALRDTGPGTESVTLSDPTRRRYARLALRDGRIAAAVLVGLPRGIATATGLYDRAAPVPPGRLDLLLGTPTRRSGPVELPDDAVICLCCDVAKGVLAQAWRGGARDLPALAAATRATTGCGGCADEVRRVCASLKNAV